MSKKQYQRKRSVHLLCDFRFFSNLGCGRTRSKPDMASSGVKGASETLSPLRPTLSFDLSFLDFLVSDCIINYRKFAPRKRISKEDASAKAIHFLAPCGAVGLALCASPSP